MRETLINVGFKIVALYHDGNVIVLDPSIPYVSIWCMFGAFDFHILFVVGVSGFL